MGHKQCGKATTRNFLNMVLETYGKDKLNEEENKWSIKKCRGKTNIHRCD